LSPLDYEQDVVKVAIVANQPAYFLPSIPNQTVNVGSVTKLVIPEIIDLEDDEVTITLKYNGTDELPEFVNLVSGAIVFNPLI
jgi:hypothetical protein